jgi:Ser/Thr protein kinase RdoA (MazF antagonist)
MSRIVASSTAVLEPAFALLLERAGIDAGVKAIEPCAIGGNNRTYRVETDAGPFAVKQYFRDESDPRDRLGSEYAFLRYASAAAPGLVPLPYSCDPDGGLALYEFVSGRPLRAGMVDRSHVEAAVSFFLSLNASAARSLASDLPLAAEACFSVAEHLDLVHGRVAALRPGLRNSEPADVKALYARLSEIWKRLEDTTRRAAAARGLDAVARLAEVQRCVSPSDFGFHNALLTADGSIRFLDFEYAGWDDPAKMSGDFFAQLAVPVPSILFEPFVAAVMKPFARSAELVERARLLRPVYQVKWCCIALNVFQPEHLARRRFADPTLDDAALKRVQARKAAALLHSIEASS